MALQVAILIVDVFRVLKKNIKNSRSSALGVITVSSDEFRIRLKVIRNSTKNVDIEIRIWGRIWFYKF